MVVTILLIILGVVLIAKHQFEILRFRYKCAEICPEKIFPTGPQSCLLTRLAKKRPNRPTMFVPLLARRIRRPLLSEFVGVLIILCSLYWAWNYLTDFSLILSIALGGVSWIIATKFTLTAMLKLCDHPTAKLVIIAITAYPILLGSLHLMDYLIFDNDFYPMIREILM